MFRTLCCSTVVLIGALTAAAAEEWRPYSDPGQHFHLDLPVTSFRQAQSNAAPGHLTLAEIEGTAVLDVYAGRNVRQLSPAAFEDQLTQAGEIRDITYRAGGRTWFVISGHYKGETALIYYAKYMFSLDGAYVAGFEISYSADERARMDPIVTHLERSFGMI